MFYPWRDRERMRNVLPLDRQGLLHNTLPLDRRGETGRECVISYLWTDRREVPPE